MGAMAHWHLQVPQELDDDVRELLAASDNPVGDIERFVRQAVEDAVLDRMFATSHAQNADLDEDEAIALATEAVRNVREARRIELGCVSRSIRMFVLGW